MQPSNAHRRVHRVLHCVPGVHRICLALATLLLLTLGASHATLPGEQEGRRDFFVLDDLYQQILVDWAGASPGTLDKVPAVETVLALARLETDLQWRPECLDALLENTVRRLSEDDPESLSTLAVLYRETYRQLFEELQFRPAGGAADRLVRITVAIAEVPASSTRTADAHAFATALLTHTAYLAVSHRHPQPLLHARTLLDRAVELGEPDSTDTLAARLWIAFLEEIEDRPRRAVRRLERILGEAPEDPEARLRLALNLLRIGRDEEGELHLRSLIEEPLGDSADNPSNEELETAPRWVRIVALEELARLLADRGERPAAAALLRRELERRPGEQGLATLLASFQGRWSASLSILRGMLAHRASDPGPSPRWRYEQGPVDHLEGMAERLERTWRTSRPAFERSLASYPHFDELRFRSLRQTLGQRPAGRLVIACQGTLGPRARRPVGDRAGTTEKTPPGEPEASRP